MGAAAYAAAVMAVGAVGLVPATDALLKKKKAQKDALWDENLENWVNTRTPSENPSRKERQLRGEADAWAKRQGLAVAGHKLTVEKVERLADTGVIGKAADSAAAETLDLMSDESEQVAYSFPRTVAATAGCAAVAAVVAAVSVAMPTALTAGVAAISGMVMACALACDVRARILPIELCAAVGVLGLALCGLTAGSGMLLKAIIAAAVMWFCTWITNTAFQRFARYTAVGAGDRRMMTALALSSGLPGAIWGFVAQAFAQGAVAVVAAVRGQFAGKGAKGALRSYVPMAPGLMAWWAVGLLTLACAGV